MTSALTSASRKKRRKVLWCSQTMTLTSMQKTSVQQMRKKTRHKKVGNQLKVEKQSNREQELRVVKKMCKSEFFNE